MGERFRLNKAQTVLSCKNGNHNTTDSLWIREMTIALYLGNHRSETSARSKFVTIFSTIPCLNATSIHH